MGKATLQNAHQKLFSSENMFFYVTGCADEKDIDYLKTAAEAYSLSQEALKRNNQAQIPAGFFHRDGKVAIKSSSDTVVRFSFDLDAEKHSQAAYMLLYDILFDCENSKIHQALSEKYGYIYSFDAGMEQYSNIGNLYFQYDVQPARLLDSIRIVMELFRQLKTGITDELDYVRAVYIDNSELILDHAANLNWTQAYEGHILGNLCKDQKQREAAYRAVAPEDITRLAREIFTKDHLVVTIKGKKSKRLQQQIETILETLDQE